MAQNVRDDGVGGSNPLTPTNKLYSKLILLNNVEICAAWSPSPTLNTDGRLPNVAVTPATTNRTGAGYATRDDFKSAGPSAATLP